MEVPQYTRDPLKRVCIDRECEDCNAKLAARLHDKYAPVICLDPSGPHTFADCIVKEPWLEDAQDLRTWRL